MSDTIATYLLGVNIVVFIFMYIDKQKAIKGTYRIPERTLWAFAILGAAIGIYAGMYTFRHKTKHVTFRIGIPVLILAEVAFLLILS